MKITKELIHLAPSGVPASGDCAAISYPGDGYLCLGESCQVYGVFSAAYDEHDDPHTISLAQVDTITLGIVDASSIASATVTFDLELASQSGGLVPRGRISGFTTKGYLKYLFSELPSTVLAFGSQVFNAKTGSNTADITSMLKFHVESGEQWFGMYFSYVEKSLLYSKATSTGDDDTAKLRLNVEYTSSSGLKPPQGFKIDEVS